MRLDFGMAAGGGAKFFCSLVTEVTDIEGC